jgi:hypothetical protein
MWRGIFFYIVHFSIDLNTALLTNDRSKGDMDLQFVSAITMRVPVEFSMAYLVLPHFPDSRPMARDRCSPRSVFTSSDLKRWISLQVIELGVASAMSLKSKHKRVYKVGAFFLKAAHIRRVLPSFQFHTNWLRALFGWSPIESLWIGG